MRKRDSYCWLKKKHNGARRLTNKRHLLSANMVLAKRTGNANSLNSRTEARVENNVDYWGADIRNFRSKGLRDCYNNCRKQKGCASFTMRKRDSYCWLKKKHNGARRLTNKRHLLSANMVLAKRTGNANSLNSRTEARVENNVDYWGADIRNFRSKGLRDCYNNCRKQKGCASFTMRKRDSYCWLKKKHNGARRLTNKRHLLSANMVLAKRTGNANSLNSRTEARVENNVDYWGADIRNFRSKGLRDCYNNCRKQKGCASFTMRKRDSYCWLKKKHNGARRLTNKRHLLSANMVLAKRTGNANSLNSRTEARVENNVDYWGADIRNFRSKGLRDCYNNCRKQKGCASFTMRKRDSYCWLKKKHNGARRLTNKRHLLSANMVLAKRTGNANSLNSRTEARVENNVDYWGADIRNFRSKGLRDCYNNCRKQKGCASFTMRKRDSYCWLKKKHNGARRLTNKRHLLSANMVLAKRTGNANSLNSRTEARVENNVDYWGADIRSFRSKGLRDCYNNCRKQKGCASFTMRKKDSYCWLKKKHNGARRLTGKGHLLSANMVLAKRTGNSNSLNSKTEARVENNVDYWGADIRSFRSKGLRDCYNNCRKQKGCASFTMRKKDSYCWLKKKHNGARRKTGKGHLLSANMVLAKRTGNANSLNSKTEARVENNVDYWGADIRSFRSKGLRDCYNNCRKQKGCASFTMRKKDSYCWLKKKHNGARRLTGKGHLLSANMVLAKRTGNANSLNSKTEARVENNVDYWGADIRSFRSKGLRDCYNNCRKQKGCASFTMRKKDSYCWLKKKHNGARRLTGKGHLLSANMVLAKRTGNSNSLNSKTEARVENNVDYWGADIRSFRSKGLRDCYNNCRKQKGCASFTMRKKDSYCWLKKKHNGARRKTGKGHLLSANMVLAKRTGNANSLNSRTEARVENNVDYWGADIRSFRSKGLRDCYNNCRKQKGCASFTMRKKESYCWLKKKHNGARRLTGKGHLLSANMVLAKRTGNANSLNSRTEARVENNVDYWGADIRSFRSKGLRDCYNNCRKQKGCASFTMRKKDSYCWLKKKHNGARRLTGKGHLLSANMVLAKRTGNANSLNSKTEARVENNVDYWGADIRSFRSKGLRDCYNNCRKQKGCASFTMRKKDSYCWLKKKHNGARRLTGKGHLLSANMVLAKRTGNANSLNSKTEARVENNVDYWGADIRSFRSKGLRDCYNNCRKQKGCASFTMRKKDSYCWLKKKHNGARRLTGKGHLLSANMVLAKRTGNANSLNSKTEARVENNVDYWGADIRSFRSKGLRDCYNNCRKQKGCASFTMRKKDSYCWLKKKHNGARRKTGKGHLLSANMVLAKLTGNANSLNSKTEARVENNVDYWGADIRSFRSKGLRDCYNNCRKQKGCASFTMRKKDSYCWLKKKHNGARRLTGKGHLLSANMVLAKRTGNSNSLNSKTEARVENNVDYWGADIRSFRSKGLRDCYNNCRKQKGCASFTMRKKDSYCWLKKKHNGARRKTGKGHLLSANMVLAKRTGNANSLNSKTEARVENNVDYWGADIRSFRSKGLRDCYNNCRKQKGCASFTMRKKDSYCWLKKKHNGARRLTGKGHLLSANMVLAKRTGNANSLSSRTEARVENNVDYWGADIRSFRSKGLRDCYNNCRKQKGCASFTMRKKDSYCWLKKKHNGARRKTGKGHLLSANMVLAKLTGNANSLNSKTEARVENNVDYWGADIRSFRSKGLRDCYNNCRKQKGCASFTMRKKDSYCWLKKKHNGARRLTGKGHLLSANMVLAKRTGNSNSLNSKTEARVENNVDYWGADIRSFRSKGLRDCYNNCRKQKGCASFTMRKKDSYCWLKKKHNGARRKTGKGHLLSANMVLAKRTGNANSLNSKTEARVENNVDYWGADIRSFRSKGLRDCYNNCRKQKGCASFTMRKKDSYCWLKKKHNGARRKTGKGHLLSANMVLAKRTGNANSLNSKTEARVENNVDYWGADIRSFRSKGLRDCYNNCRKQKGCASFTMRKKDSYCWLKKKHNGARRLTGKGHLLSANMVLAKRTGNSNSLNSKTEARVENNVDYWGADIRSFRSKGLRDCYNNCRKQKGCASFTMRKKDSYCWLKKKHNGARRLTGKGHLLSANMVLAKRTGNANSLNSKTEARVENNVDYWGADIRSFRSKGLRDCYNNCRKQKGCASFTMRKKDSYCWLKKKHNGARRLTGKGHLLSANMVLAKRTGNSNSLNSKTEARVENNVDYWGADIRSFRSKGLRDCYNNCRKQKGCASFTMRKKDSYCWLKKKHNGARRKTGKGHLLSANMVLAKRTGNSNSLNSKTEARVENNVDYWGADIRSFRSKGLRDCYNNCRKQKGCASFTMRKKDSYCWLKKKHNGARRMTGKGHLLSANMVLAKRTGNANSLNSKTEARVENNVDYWGADIRSFRSKGLRDCYNNCRKQKGCASFTMRKKDSYCWLKKKHNGARRLTGKGHLLSANMVLAKRTGNSNSLNSKTEARVENNVDYWGADIRSFRSKGLRDCYNNCRKQKGCASFTMRKKDSYCWLKKKHNGARRKTGKGHLLSANMVLAKRTGNSNSLNSKTEARVENNVDYWGADIRSFRSKGLRDCYNNCRKQKGCASFTMRKKDSYCWLKKKHNGAKRKTGKGHLLSANMVLKRGKNRF
ncbi:uncharacterized protein LOC134821656 [Bolinopsis microptera]|uniref:uncharacterized protein LOC134821656 n=1 Tax=Bolinopsis microptera TaxID=2820187 RepID=UPI003078CA3A